jgi:hypothetical protein
MTASAAVAITKNTLIAASTFYLLSVLTRVILSASNER